MKLSVSLPPDDVAFLDAHARKQGLGSRSSAVRDAVRLLRKADLQADYEDAFQEWHASGEAAAWETVPRDGLS